MADAPYEVTWNARNPQNLNYSRPTGFRLDILNLPQVAFFCQTVTLPGITLGVAEQPTPLSDIPWPGEKIKFFQLDVRFIIQSDFANYVELYNWFIGIGSPTNNNEFASWAALHQWRSPIKNGSSELFSDAVLSVLSANNNPVMQFHFHNMFPIAMQGIEFDIASGKTDYLTAYTTFRYHYFVPVPLTTT